MKIYGRGLVFTAAALAAMNGCAASPLDGSWAQILACPKDNDLCAGRSEMFVLDLWSTGTRLCGSHMATGHMGNRVDENDAAPSIAGPIKGNKAIVAYQSSWGGTGHARIERIGNILHWHVIDRDNGQSWIWDDASLRRKKPAAALPKSCTVDTPAALD